MAKKDVEKQKKLEVYLDRSAENAIVAEEQKTQISARLPTPLIRRLKKYCIDKDQRMAEVIGAAIKSFLDSKDYPP